MPKIGFNDTIAAIATPMGESGIGVVRISGKGAVKAMDKVFRVSDGAKAVGFKTHTVHHGWIHSSSGIIDEALVTVFREPNSYTGEDCVEVSCHGSIVALRSTLDAILENGCRMALPGEFTKRAFLNGKIDLSQAEAVLDIIKAKTEAALEIGIRQLKGGLSLRINRIREAVLEIVTILESKIDFPQEDTDNLDLKKIKTQLNNIGGDIKSLLVYAGQGRILREGLSAVICGKPNVGKSSLLNALLKTERSIVTPIAGTTRDTLEEILDIRGIPVRIVDTAGIIEPGDLIEKKAVKRSEQYIACADLIILVFDGNKKLSRDDEVLIRKLKSRKLIAVVNKSDLPQRIEKDRLQKIFANVVEISAKKSKNIKGLEYAVEQAITQGAGACAESAWISNLRHIRALKSAQKLIAEALNSLDNGLSIEFLAQGLKEALGYFDDILGKRFSEELLDKIFSEFCIGK